jgi:ABC-type transport system involved in multi-copper enzyme maturation permease subunit
VTALFRSELLKLRTTRTAVVLALGLYAIALIAAVGSLIVNDSLDRSVQADLPGAAAFAVLFSILFGILVMTGEYRHGTATPTFLATPRRERVLAAKAVAAAVGGLTLALSALVLVYAVAIPWLLVTGHSVLLFEREPLRGALGLVAAAAIWGALGVGVGAVVRSQVGAMIGALVWFLILEPLVGHLVSSVAPYLPGAALGAIFEGSEELSSWAGAAVSLGYAAAFCLAGTVLTVRRDIT